MRTLVLVLLALDLPVTGQITAPPVTLRLAGGDLMVEAKLTETDFQTATARMIERYRDLEEVFDLGELMMSSGVISGYQLIRGVLAERLASSVGHRCWWVSS